MPSVKPIDKLFTPNVTPRDIFLKGSFGGTYWRKITSGVTKKSYKDAHKEFSEFDDIPSRKSNNRMTLTKKNKSINKYKVIVGMGKTAKNSLLEWERKKWIHEKDPYGWVQWYCRYTYNNRRLPEEDNRQIKRWLAFAGPNGRFRKWLIRLIKEKNTSWDDMTVSPKIRQGLLHWGYELTKKDYDKGLLELLNNNKKG
jgi:hypothetical protein